MYIVVKRLIRVSSQLALTLACLLLFFWLACTKTAPSTVSVCHSSLLNKQVTLTGDDSGFLLGWAAAPGLPSAETADASLKQRHAAAQLFVLWRVVFRVNTRRSYCSISLNRRRTFRVVPRVHKGNSTYKLHICHKERGQLPCSSVCSNKYL